MKKWLILGGSTLILAACGGKDKISQSDLQKALNHSPAGQVCVPFTLEVSDRKSHEAPYLTALGSPEIRLLKRLDNGKRANTRAIEQMEILVNAGIYEEMGVNKSGDVHNPTRHLVYRLSEKGRGVFRHQAQGLSMCIGRLEVEKIHYYTEPTPSHGLTMTRVSYEASIKPERWAKQLLANSPYHQGLKQSETRNMTLVKTNEGWREIHSLH